VEAAVAVVDVDVVELDRRLVEDCRGRLRPSWVDCT